MQAFSVEDRVLTMAGYRFGNPREKVYKHLMKTLWARDGARPPMTVDAVHQLIVSDKVFTEDTGSTRIRRMIEEFLNNMVDSGQGARITLVEKLPGGKFRPTDAFYGRGVL